MSLDSAHMNLADAFEYGQGYVALSRVRTLAGLSLAGLNARALEVHPKIKEKDAHFRASSAAARQKFRTLSSGELQKMHDNFLKAIGGKKGTGSGKVLRSESFAGKASKKDTLSITKDLALKGLSLPEIAKERGMTLGTILNHLEQLKEKGTIDPSRDLSHLTPDPDRFATSKSPQSPAKTKELKLSPVGNSSTILTYDELKLARLFRCQAIHART